jgi:hypothetical protein
MKAVFVLLFAVALVNVSTAWSTDNTAQAARFTRATVEQTEKSLVMALASNSVGLRTSAAQTVRDLKALMPERSFSHLVIPLMRIVKDQNMEDCSRVVAALALHELHSATGDFAIEREARLTDCAKMKHLCSWLAYIRYLEDHPDAKNQASKKIDELTMRFGE